MTGPAAPNELPEIVTALVAIGAAVNPLPGVPAVFALMVLSQLLCECSCVAALPISHLLCACHQAFLVELRALAVSPADAADVAELGFAKATGGGSKDLVVFRNARCTYVMWLHPIVSSTILWQE